MKRGISRQEKLSKRPKINDVPLSIENLCDDALSVVLNYVPAYNYFGSKTITTVCKKWKQLFEASQFFNKKDYQKIIDSCLDDPTGALYLLGDETIRQHLTWDQFLEISACNTELVLHILNTPELSAKLKGNNLAILAQHHLTTSQQMLYSSELCAKLDEDDLASYTRYAMAMR